MSIWAFCTHQNESGQRYGAQAHTNISKANDPSRSKKQREEEQKKKTSKIIIHLFRFVLTQVRRFVVPRDHINIAFYSLCAKEGWRKTNKAFWFRYAAIYYTCINIVQWHIRTVCVCVGIEWAEREHHVYHFSYFEKSLLIFEISRICGTETHIVHKHTQTHKYKWRNCGKTTHRTFGMNGGKICQWHLGKRNNNILEDVAEESIKCVEMESFHQFMDCVGNLCPRHTHTHEHARWYDIVVSIDCFAIRLALCSVWCTLQRIYFHAFQ